MSDTLIDLSRWWGIERGDTPAIVTHTDRVTYRELDRWADALAAWLVDMGLEVGDRVTVVAANSLGYCALTQGVLRAGGLLAPLNPRFTASEAAYMLSRFEPKFLFHDSAHEDLVRASIDGMSGIALHNIAEVGDLRHRQRIPSHRDIGRDTPVVIIATSGSTARPKGVVYSHRSMVAYAAQFAFSEPHTTDRARAILFAPLSTSAGYVVLTQYLSYGGTIYVDEAFDAERALTWIIEEKISCIQGVPVFFERIAACDRFAGADLSHIRLASVGGARVSQQLLQAYIDKGVLLRQIYGQTEAGGQATINTPKASLTHPEKCGHGLAFTRIAIMNPEGNFCPAGTAGEIVLRGAGMMVGYWRDPETTAKTVVDGWLHTGDLGVMDEDGLLTMVDRIKDIIISGGLNISAAEVERVVAEYPGVVEVATIAAQDEKFGETPLAVIYATTAIDVAALIAHCCKHLSDFKVPRYVALEPEPLPRLATGKIAKPALREKYAEAHRRLARVR